VRRFVAIHWVGRAYLTSDAEIERVVGAAIKVRRKSAWTISKDVVDVLCGKCGAVLHESEAARFGPARPGPRDDQPVLKDAREYGVAGKPTKPRPWRVM
jgi:hypothetical protein